VIDLIIQHADVDLEAGNGCRSLRISKKGRAMLIRNGGASVTDVERAADVIVVLCEESNEIVTVMHDCNSLGSRRFRRQFPTWNLRAA
jgi:transcription termination factor Rho